MKRSHRLFATGLAAAALLLSGCGKEPISAPQQTATAQVAPSEAASEPAGEPSPGQMQPSADAWGGPLAEVAGNQLLDYDVERGRLHYGVDGELRYAIVIYASEHRDQLRSDLTDPVEVGDWTCQAEMSGETLVSSACVRTMEAGELVVGGAESIEDVVAFGDAFITAWSS